MKHEWMNEARCREYDPETFFPEMWDKRTAKLAVGICKTSCPVIVECSVYRKSIDAYSGVWHGHWFRPASNDADTRRKEGLEMAANGIDAVEIAMVLEIPEAVVHRWIKKEKKRLEGPNARPLNRMTGGRSDE